MTAEDFKPGAKYRLLGGLYHVRAIVDGDQVVARAWSRGQWAYMVEEADMLAARVNGHAKWIKRQAEQAAQQVTE